MFATCQAVDEIFRKKQLRWMAYLLLFVIALMVRLSCYTGLAGSDDLWYSYFAQRLSHGAYPLRVSHIQFRIGFIVPLAFSYAALGVSEWTSVLVPLVLSAASAPLLVSVGRRLLPAAAAVIAGLFLTSFPLHVHYATIPGPEPVMEFFVLAGVLAYLLAIDRQRPMIGCVAGLCFGVAYQAKESAIFVALALFLYSLRRQRKIAITLVAGLFAVVAADQLCYWVRTGDPLFRQHVTADTQARYSAANPEPMPYRVLKTYPRLMVVPNFDLGVHSCVAFLLAIAGVFAAGGKAARLLILWAAIPFLYLNFGSSSLTHYTVLPSAARYLGLVYAPVFLLAGAGCYFLLSRTPRLILPILLLVSVSGVACALSMAGRGYRTAAMTSLRTLVREARHNEFTITHFEGADAPIWSCAASILSQAPPAEARCAHNCLMIKPDSLGLPSAVQTSPDLSTNALPAPPCEELFGFK
jgi:Dolichyl-phosphate-mannose-protein mannosyltransferase